MENNIRNAVILGALLHDIGKFVQRAGENPTQKKHTEWGIEWFENNLAEKLTNIFSNEEKDFIRQAINSHHDFVDYVTVADHLSAGERSPIPVEKEEKGDPFNDRLINIFSILYDGQPLYNKIISLGGNHKLA